MTPRPTDRNGHCIPRNYDEHPEPASFGAVSDPRFTPLSHRPQANAELKANPIMKLCKNCVHCVYPGRAARCNRKTPPGGVHPYTGFPRTIEDMRPSCEIERDWRFWTPLRCGPWGRFFKAKKVEITQMS